jgi:hypothetical protein
MFEKVWSVLLHTQRSPLAPLKKGKTGLEDVLKAYSPVSSVTKVAATRTKPALAGSETLDIIGNKMTTLAKASKLQNHPGGYTMGRVP